MVAIIQNHGFLFGTVMSVRAERYRFPVPYKNLILYPKGLVIAGRGRSDAVSARGWCCRAPTKKGLTSAPECAIMVTLVDASLNHTPGTRLFA